ncbi:hypothetical protein [Enterococcus faecalis]|uniref:hypothetical protein n=1 Tax=Enterococcus faecalis TaxID=1351 RepID=UPI00289147D0|nr:hypothetical protein [Enterococcus faecalis]MDT2226253.1 hypothetical protein [Enterococcus faecalis]
MQPNTQLEIYLSKINKRTPIEEMKFTLYGCATIFFLSKQLFPLNKDIQIFINSFKLNPIEKKYGDYLYKSRTLLLSRIIRDIKVSEVDRLTLYINAMKALVFSDSYNYKETIDTDTKKNYFDELFNQFGG